jgi:ketosteroid isomerase-like protein
MTAALLLLTAFSALAQGSAEKAVLKMEQDWATALMKVDTAALNQIYSDDLVYTHSSGQTDDKAKYVANIKNGVAKYEEVKFETQSVKVYGNTAIAYSTAKLRVLTNNQTLNNHLKLIHVYVKQGKDWKMVAHQSTRLPQ